MHEHAPLNWLIIGHPVPEKSLCGGEAAVYAQFVTVQAKATLVTLALGRGLILLLSCRLLDKYVANPPVLSTSAINGNLLTLISKAVDYMNSSLTDAQALNYF